MKSVFGPSVKVEWAGVGGIYMVVDQRIPSRAEAAYVALFRRLVSSGASVNVVVYEHSQLSAERRAIACLREACELRPFVLGHLRDCEVALVRAATLEEVERYGIRAK